MRHRNSLDKASIDIESLCKLRHELRHQLEVIIEYAQMAVEDNPNSFCKRLIQESSISLQIFVDDIFDTYGNEEGSKFFRDFNRLNPKYKGWEATFKVTIPTFTVNQTNSYGDNEKNYFKRS